MKAPKKAQGIVAVVLALAVGIGVVAAITLVDGDGPVSTLAVEGLAVLALIAGGLIAWLSHSEAADKGDDPGKTDPSEDAHPGKLEDEWPGR